MAIEIIPKPEVKVEKIGTIFFAVGLVALLTVSTIYIALFFIQKKKTQELESLDSYFEEFKNSKASLERDIKRKRQEIDEFSDLFNNHRSSVNYFDFIERNTHAKVRWYGSTLDLGEEIRVTISGHADNFIILAQQLLIFKKHPDIEEIDISMISMEETGGAEFGLEILLRPSLFKFKLE